MKQLILLVLGMSMGTAVFSQKLVSSLALGEKSKSEIIAKYGLPAPFVKNGGQLFKLTYTTLDIHNQPDTASGLIVVPDVTGEYPLLCYQHGTVNSKSEVPSNVDGSGYPRGDELPVPFAAFGYVVVAPDYLGLGDSRGFHPYVHAATEASAAVDMLFAAREFMASQASSLNDQLFISGYSQGGHAAMAAYRSIQQDYASDFTVTAAAPMSGPYSISGAMKDVIIQDEPYYFTAYLPNTLLSFDLAYDLFDDLSEYFKEPYATPIRQYQSGAIDLGALNGTLISLLSVNHGGSYPKYMLQDSILAVAQNNDETHPVSLALKANDVYDWQPLAPTRLYYCTADDQVTYRNSIIADSVMQLNNAPDLETIDVNPIADHGGCVNPAVTSTIFFFAQYQKVTITTATEDLAATDLLLEISPNPAGDFVDLKWQGEAGQIELYNGNGKKLRTDRLVAGQSSRIDVSSLPAGIYFVYASDGKQTVVKRVVKD